MNLATLADTYLADPDSSFEKLRYVTKEGYKRLLTRLKKDMGDKDLTALKTREIKQQHDAWVAGSGVAMAHGLITMLRVIIGFGATILEDEDCKRIRPMLKGMKFQNAKPRTVWLTGEQATWVRDDATEKYYYAIALAQAFQQDCALRQKDVIGEWIPVAEPVPSTIFSLDGTEKWVRGITREEVTGDDDHLILRHQTSKRGQILTFPLNSCPSVMEEWFSAPPSGPLIIDPETNLPYEAWKFRRTWRWLAGLAGVPKGIWNMDSRAGRITERLGAGATLDDTRKLAGHSQIQTTIRYSRDTPQAVARALGLNSPEDNPLPEDGKPWRQE